MSHTGKRFKLRLKLVLLVVNLAVLLLPLFGLFFFRFYENALVQQTESELIAQSAVMGSMYADALQRAGAPNDYGRIISAPKTDEYYTPIQPQIDLSHVPLLPRRPQGTATIANALALQAGNMIYPALKHAQRTTLSGIRVLDYNGVVVAGSDEIGQDFSDFYEVQRALQGEYASVIRDRVSDNPPPTIASISRGTGTRVFTAYPVQQNGRILGVIYLSRTPKNILKHLYAEKEKVIIAGLSILLLTLIIALVTSYSIARPIHRLIRAIDAFSKGDVNAMKTLDAGGVREINMLGERFRNMALTLHERSEYIREFALSVSHEFKTPVTAIQGAVELLLDDMESMDTATKQRFLSNIAQDADRMKRLMQRLLELAKADNINSSSDTTDVAHLVNALKARYADRQLAVRSNNLPDRLPLSQEHLESILVNLCDNAAQHGANEISISATEQDRQIVLSVQDNGEGISSANQHKVFDAFFTTKRAEGGTGLGLRIVQSLLKHYGGTIQTEESIKGALFKIKIPQ